MRLFDTPALLLLIAEAAGCRQCHFLCVADTELHAGCTGMLLTISIYWAGPVDGSEAGRHGCHSYHSGWNAPRVPARQASERRITAGRPGPDGNIYPSPARYQRQKHSSRDEQDCVCQAQRQHLYA
jgi:hypothetical protein